MKLETQKTEKSKNMDVGMKKSSRESFRWVVRQASCHMPHDPQTSTNEKQSRDETREERRTHHPPKSQPHAIAAGGTMRCWNAINSLHVILLCAVNPGTRKEFRIFCSRSLFVQNRSQTKHHAS